MAAIAKTQVPQDLRHVIDAVCGVGIKLSKIIAKGQLGDKLAIEVGVNSDGDGQKALDIIADNAFAEALRDKGVRYYASEERATVDELDSAGDLALAIDPLDGSSNIDVNVSIGTIFSIRMAGIDGPTTFLGSNRNQLAAGYIIYGPQTSLVVTFGQGTLLYGLDADTGRFEFIEILAIPKKSQEFAINASNYRHWRKPIRNFIDDCLSGEAGPKGKNYNMRWVASLVAEAHRIIMRGGIFLYPDDAREGYESGRLRLVYECAPISFLIEQAGGTATDGHTPILDLKADTLHARSPLIFGSPENTEQLDIYQNEPDKEQSALFHDRGLYRS